MNLNTLAAEVNRVYKLKPHLKNELKDIYSLAADEIEDGASETNECELAMGSIRELEDSDK